MRIRYINLDFTYFTFSYFEKIGDTGQTGERGKTLNAAPREGRIILFSCRLQA